MTTLKKPLQRRNLRARVLRSVLLSLTLCTFSSILAQTAPAPYSWKNVIVRGGGFVSGIAFSSVQRDLVYLRTDVGGAYRSDDGGEHWIAITDGIGRRDANFTGIESIALDPSDAGKVYLAAGLYTGEWAGPAAMLRSSDRGRSWQRTVLPFKMGGNEDGRNCGEKLAVDPHLGSVLFFGSRKDGLWKSVNSGESWAKVESFPVRSSVDGPWQKLGISFVTYDSTTGAKGSATPTIYVGVAQAGANLYRSDDAGVTWRLVAGAPKSLFPCHAVPNRAGAIFFTFNNNIGPNGITDGAVLRYSTADGRWQDVSPVKPGVGTIGRFGFGGLALDAQHPDTLMATTIDRWWPSDLIFRSTDGGRHWKDVHADAVYSATDVPWVYWHKDRTGGTGWMNDIAIDPFRSSKALYTTGEGLWGSDDVVAADHGRPTHWGFPDDGLEETVPLALISPPEGPHLISGVGDIGGFRHDDLTRSPSGGFFDDPVFTNTDSLDFAAQKPSWIVRVGRGSDKIVHGAYSSNGGSSWRPFDSEPPTSRYGSGHIAISADGAVVIWTPEKGSAYWSADMGRTWTACGGLHTAMDVVSNRVNPNRFYSFDPKTGKLFQSMDKGRSFVERQTTVASPGNHVTLAPTPGIEGDLWVVAAGSVFHTTDSGGTFTKLDDLEKAYTFGFGKSAPGQSYPALYLTAERNKVEGIYRSDDSGKTWQRINDDAHQYGSIGAISGDPRVYGRVYLATGGRGILYGDLSAGHDAQ